MKLLLTLSLLCLFVAVISAKKQKENIDILEGETKEHGSKKYAKDSQKSHHHGHKHKKQHHNPVEQLEPVEALPKHAPVEIPEPEIELQSDIETSKKAIDKKKHIDQTEDLHLQDLTHEENLKKEKKKKNHHGSHHADVTEKKSKNNEQKLFAEQEGMNPVEEKVIEDSFEPLTDKHGHEERKNKGKDKKNKNKKASEKNSNKGKKHKDGKKSKDGKNKDKKNKNKDKKW